MGTLRHLRRKIKMSNAENDANVWKMVAELSGVLNDVQKRLGALESNFTQLINFTTQQGQLVVKRFESLDKSLEAVLPKKENNAANTEGNQNNESNEKAVRQEEGGDGLLRQQEQEKN